MANYYRNPTASAAIGSIDRELNRAEKHAKKLKALREQGRLTSGQLVAARRQHTGLARRVFENTLR